MSVLAVVAVAPDLDVIGLWLGIPYGHPLGHRGFSHSLLFAALLAAAIARFGFGTVRRWRAFLVLFAATASHGVLDAFTDGGLGVGFLIPFWNARYFAPVRPLPVSPIGIDGSAIDILGVELVHVWLPVFVLLAASAIWRTARMRARAPRSRAASS
jgi:inner membrane protein